MGTLSPTTAIFERKMLFTLVSVGLLAIAAASSSSSSSASKHVGTKIGLSSVVQYGNAFYFWDKQIQGTFQHVAATCSSLYIADADTSEDGFVNKFKGWRVCPIRNTLASTRTSKHKTINWTVCTLTVSCRLVRKTAITAFVVRTVLSTLLHSIMECGKLLRAIDSPDNLTSTPNDLSTLPKSRTMATSAWIIVMEPLICKRPTTI